MFIQLLPTQAILWSFFYTYLYISEKHLDVFLSEKKTCQIPSGMTIICKLNNHYVCTTDYGHTMAKSLLLGSPNSNPNAIWIGLVFFCRNNGWLRKNIDKELTVQNWVLINRPKIPQMPQNLSSQILCPSLKVWGFDKTRLHWGTVVRGLYNCCQPMFFSIDFVKALQMLFL